MKTRNQIFRISLLLSAAWLLTAGLAQGANDDRRDRDRQDNDRSERNDERRDNDQEQNRYQESQRHFEDRDRVTVHDYYRREYQGSRCPRGLEKKRNGCVPPGHAQHWDVGQRLPPGVVYYEVPPTLVRQMGPPPRGSRYVRVAGDILLMTIGTQVILDSLEDLNR